MNYLIFGLMIYVIPLIIGIIFAKYFEEDYTTSKDDLIVMTMFPAINIVIAAICLLLMFYYLLHTIAKNDK